MPMEYFEVIINNASHSPRHAQSMSVHQAAEWNRICLSAPPPRPQRLPLKQFILISCSWMCLQAFSLGQIQLINDWVTESGGMSYLEKAVIHTPHQRKRGPKTIFCACVCVPFLETLIWIFVAKCNFCATAGSLDVLGEHRSTRRNHLTCHKGTIKTIPLITLKTGANHFPSADFCFSAKLWLFYCCHAKLKLCLHHLSVWVFCLFLGPGQKAFWAWMAALFPCSEEILGKCSQTPSLVGKKN